MRITICELPDNPTDLEPAWSALTAHVREHASEFVLLPEMPFSGWFARERGFDAAVWAAAVAAHEAWLPRLADLSPAVVAGSRPVERDGVRLNEGFVWDAAGGYRAAHHKRYLPDEAGFWEASWYARGGGVFEPLMAGPACVGFLICTELWFLERARAYGKQGAHLVATPRATERATVEKWLVGGRAAAVVSGAYSLSSNRAGTAQADHPMGGQGWIVSPDGEVLALTSAAQPFATIDVDLGAAERARHTYPRCVIE